MISIVIVDDHAMVRKGLRSILDNYPDFAVIGEAENGESVFRLLEKEPPDILLMDFRLQGPNGLEIAKQIKVSYPSVKTIIISAYDDENAMVESMKAGVYAFLQKSISDDNIAQIIRSVNNGTYYLSESQIDPIIREFQIASQKQVRHDFELSETDINLLQMMAQGLSSSEIADETFWSERTVKRRIHDIIQKLHVKNRTEAVVEAMKKGII